MMDAQATLDVGEMDGEQGDDAQPGLQVVCDQGQLRQALVAVKKAVAAKSLMPILTTILVQAVAAPPDGRTDGETDDLDPETGEMRERVGARLWLTATDLNLVIQTWIPATVARAGALCLNAERLVDFVNMLPGGVLTLDAPSANAPQARIRCGRSSGQIAAMDADDYPSITIGGDGDDADQPVTLALAAGDLRRMLAGVQFATAKAVLQSGISCVRVGLRDANGQVALNLAGTDGFRLAYQTATLDLAADMLPAGGIEMLIGTDAIAHVLETLRTAGSDEQVLLTVAGNGLRVEFESGAWRLTARLSDARFPVVERLLPTYPVIASVDVAPLARAVRMAMVFTRDQAKTGLQTVTMRYTPGDGPTDGDPTDGDATAGFVGTLSVRGGQRTATGTTDTTDVGETQLDAVVRCDTTQIQYINGINLLDALDYFARYGERVDLALLDPAHALVITMDALPGYRYMTMPLHFRD